MHRSVYPSNALWRIWLIRIMPMARIIETRMNRATLFRLFTLIGAACLLAGCHDAASPVHDVAAIASAPQDEPALHLTTAGRVATDDKADLHILRDDLDILLQLDIYQLTVPFGAISSSGTLPENIDEDHVDLATHALLLNNGLRFGIGANDEWGYYKSLIDRSAAIRQKSEHDPVQKGIAGVAVALEYRTQDIFFLTDHWKGRTYDKCDNLLALTFEPTPRQPGDATIRLALWFAGFAGSLK